MLLCFSVVEAMEAKTIRALRLSIFVMFLLLDLVYWIWDKFQNCEASIKRSFYCPTKVNYSAHFFGSMAGKKNNFLYTAKNAFSRFFTPANFLVRV
jgi:hypothetical protein